MKYIVFRMMTENHKIVEFAITFPKEITHSDISETLCRNDEFFRKHYAEPARAGFVDFHNGKTFGCSETLGLQSAPTDIHIIRNGVANADW